MLLNSWLRRTVDDAIASFAFGFVQRLVGQFVGVVKLMRSDFDKSSVTDTRSSLAEALIDLDSEQHTQAAQWLLSGTRRGPPTAIKIKLGRRFMVGSRLCEIRQSTLTLKLLGNLASISMTASEKSHRVRQRLE